MRGVVLRTGAGQGGATTGGGGGAGNYPFEDMSVGEITGAGWVTDENGVRVLGRAINTPLSAVVKLTTADHNGVDENPFEDWDAGDLSDAGWTDTDGVLTRTTPVGREFAIVLKCTTADNTTADQVPAKVVADASNYIRVVRKATTADILVEIANAGIVHTLDMGPVANETAFVIAASFAHNDCTAILDDGDAVTDDAVLIPAGLEDWTVNDASWEGSVEALDIIREQCAVELSLSAFDRITVARTAIDREMRVRVTKSAVVQAELDMGAVADETAIVIAARIDTDDFEAILDDGDAVTDSSGTPPPNVSLWTVGSDRDKAHPWGGTVEALEVL